MGLLDQVLGQVLGGRGSPGGSLTGGQGGGLGGGLGGMLSGGGKGPIAMALLSLLASRQFGGGSAGSPGGMLGGGSSGGQTGGGMLDALGGMFGGGASSSTGGLGGLLGGGLTGGALAGGLGDLLGRFGQTGHGDIAQSWVGTGPNAPISPDQLGQVLDPGTVDQLSEQTGLGRGDLLSQLSTVLPQVVDKLTPNGRLPTPDEHSQWV